jgi:hypothetical protein
MEIGCYGTEGYGTEGGPKQSECVHCVFPTRVGMVCESAIAWSLWTRVPHARGDGPTAMCYRIVAAAEPQDKSTGTMR